MNVYSIKRREPRIRIRTGVVISGKDARGEVFTDECFTIDVSPHGASFTIERQLTHGTIVDFTAKNYAFKARAVVCGVSRDEAEGTWIYGVEYLDGARNPIVVWSDGTPHESTVVVEGPEDAARSAPTLPAAHESPRPGRRVVTVDLPAPPPSQRGGYLGAQVLSHGVAVLATLTALLFALLLQALGVAAPEPLFVVAVVVAATHGGTWPGLVATALSAILLGWFFTELGEDVARVLAELVVFAGVAGLVCLLTSRRAYAERKLRESRERFQVALEAAQMGAWEWSISEGVMRWTPGLASLHGLSPHMQGATYETYISTVHPDDQQQVARAVVQAIEEGHDYTLEFRVLWPDASEHWLFVRGHAFRGEEDGPVTKMLGVEMDVTERKNAETNRQLLLQREQTLRAQVELENRVRDDFLAALSHELKAPLTTIIGWVGVLESEEADDQTIRRALREIADAAQAQAAVVSELVETAGVIAGRLSWEAGQVAFEEIVAEAVECVRPAALARSLSLTLHVDDHAGPVRGDANHLRRVVDHLLSNAVKFTPDGGEIKVAVNSTDDHVVLEVSDTGIGIPAEKLEGIFDVFKQGDGSLTSRYGGLGVGLTIVRRLVELHGGCVSATSPGEGAGTTFSVSLPIAAVAGKHTDDGSRGTDGS